MFHSKTKLMVYNQQDDWYQVIVDRDLYENARNSIEKWCNEHVMNINVFCFRIEEDAIHFKMVWG